MLKLTELEISWLAGLFEGEGSFTVNERKKRRESESDGPPSPPTFVISMTDKDILERVGRLLNQPVLELKRLTSSGLKVYRVQCQGREKVFQFCSLLYPWMGERPKKQIEVCFKASLDYQEWRVQGGKRRLAQKANFASQIAKKKKKDFEILPFLN